MQGFSCFAGNAQQGVKLAELTGSRVDAQSEDLARASNATVVARLLVIKRIAQVLQTFREPAKLIGDPLGRSQGLQLMRG